MQVGLGRLCKLVFRQIMNRVFRSRKVYKGLGSVLEIIWFADVDRTQRQELHEIV